MRALLKQHLTPSQFATLKQGVARLRTTAFPVIPGVHHLLYHCHQLLTQSWHTFWQKCYFTPLFLSQLKHAPKQVQLYSGMPQLLGQLDVDLGEQCRISGVSTWCGRAWSAQSPQLIIGHNVDIGWQNTLAVGDRIQIDDNVRLAGRVFLAGFPGHPFDPQARAAGEPDLASQVGTIHLCRNAWLGTGVMVMAGVTIGENSVIAAGSVVTKDIPSNVLAGGNPARVIKTLEY
ncbi:acetyltransferase [Photobacterium jeanii]|uniref:Acetyltransferase n=1 Tax=Photobacterium jeanii TaxID=858640 RepID=A0A178KHR4_9GAMM|nr:acyltransferase [Photobacterium jeanii]OAN16817.1 acetyltransferase [Photobacterium jeanii]PST88426.1 acyltransferase [Photobacterium jeanii]